MNFYILELTVTNSAAGKILIIYDATELHLSISRLTLCVSYLFVCLFFSSTDEFNPFVPKLEKSVSGSSPSRDRLLLTVTMLLLAALLIS